MIFGSRALSGLMLDLGVLKIGLGGVFSISISNPAGHYPNPAGQS